MRINYSQRESAFCATVKKIGRSNGRRINSFLLMIIDKVRQGKVGFSPTLPMREKAAKREKSRKSAVGRASGRGSVAGREAPRKRAAEGHGQPTSSEVGAAAETVLAALRTSVSVAGRQAGAMPPPLPVPIASFTI